MSGERVIVVDDEPQIRRALGMALSGHGYEVEVAEDGESALTLLASRPPDVMVLDLVMPGMDGFEVLRQTRTWSQLPIIVLSARGQERDKVAALDLGADDYLTKPFGMAELLARLRAALRRAVAPSEPCHAFGNVTVDTGRHVVTKNGREVHLTPTEFDLLRVLLSNPDKVLTHRQLLERVWGGYAAENSRQLRVYINYLRRKIEDDPARPAFLVTEPGVGYRLRTGDGN
ncbi:MAG TPA: response regulator transcription factor [Thermomicrobiales bacterium]|nr:response regulator transcription factor [Thermomicrobiales bacterium]